MQVRLVCVHVAAALVSLFGIAVLDVDDSLTFIIPDKSVAAH